MSCRVVIAGALALLVSSKAHGDEGKAGKELSKKEREWRAKLARQPGGKARAAELRRWHAVLALRIGKRPRELINIFNGWTHEYIAIPKRAGQSSVPPAELVNRFLRCRYTNQRTNMDPRLLAILVEAANHFGSDRVDVISGYRSPKYNLTLRKKGRQVARRSQHTTGKAVDFALRGVPTLRLHAWAVQKKLGGVGLYRQSGFVHMDTDRVRYWEGR